MRLRIAVTAADIRKGTRSAHHCPVALACLRKEYTLVAVTPTYIRFDSGGETRVPKRMTAWVRAFDANRAVKPFSFVIANAPIPKKKARKS
jgi:hypothetical protein